MLAPAHRPRSARRSAPRRRAGGVSSPERRQRNQPPMRLRGEEIKMFKRWGHGHSLGAGLMFGLMLADYRVWLLFAFAFLLGCAFTVAVVSSRRIAGWLKERVED